MTVFRRTTSNIIKILAQVFNDETPAQIPLAREKFINARKNALSGMDEERQRVFKWSLQDSDGRGDAYQKWEGGASVKRWLEWYRPKHLIWNKPDDALFSSLEKPLSALGKATWKKFFTRYLVNHYGRHDLYSLPDVYYCAKALGHIPATAIDIGGGWGRLGMAWAAVGCKSVTIMDSIEQPYILQNLYLKSIPGIQFNELLEWDQEISSQQLNGVNHVPFWNISLIPAQSIEVVTAVQLLREVDEAMVLFLLNQLQRILKPGGIFYIRDNDPAYKTASMHHLDIHKLLEETGFKLMMQPALIQGKDIHGLPRIYQWNPQD